MAQQTQVLLIGDLDGNKGRRHRPRRTAPGTRSAWPPGHARALRDTLARYVAAARRAGGGRRPARAGRGASVSGLNPRGSAVGQGAGYRGERPRTGAGSAGGQVQGGHRQI